MADFAAPLERLIQEFKRLPGIGQKSAQRIAFHVMRSGRDEAERLTQAILDVKDRLTLCAICNNISDGERDVSHNQWLLADRQRARRRQQWAEFFKNVDVLLCPITLTPAFPHQQDGTWATREIIVNDTTVAYLSLESWPALIGSAYLPSTSTPVGHTASGLPVGVQVVSPYLHDHRSIAVAGLISDLVDGYAVPPIAR